MLKMIEIIRINRMTDLGRYGFMRAELYHLILDSKQNGRGRSSLSAAAFPSIARRLLWVICISDLHRKVRHFHMAVTERKCHVGFFSAFSYQLVKLRIRILGDHP